jgi:predicted nuclease with RNAse H fold
MEPIADLGINLMRIVPVETAEGLAVVEIHPAVSHIKGVQRCGESLAEILAEGKIEGRV